MFARCWRLRGSSTASRASLKQNTRKDEFLTMPIPTRSQCLALMDRTQMPPHIRRHSFMVAEIALYLARRLNTDSIRLNLELTEAAALLHDIAKARSIATGERHDELGARMLHDWGYPALAPIVQDHTTMDFIRVHGPVTESVLVNYADKRVKHDQVVTIEDRFHDLVERYAKTRESKVYLLKRLDLYLVLEKKIFEHLNISPAGRELMQLSPDTRPEREWSYNEQQELESGLTGGRKIR